MKNKIILLFLVLTCFYAFCANKSYNVRNLGAVGDGITQDTDAINLAIKKCSEAGGGTVVFPAGTYLSGSIHLQSNITLQLDEGAVILGAPNDMNAYDHPEPNPWEQYQDFGHSHFRNALIWGENLENIIITGKGTINGGGITRSNSMELGGGDKALSLKLCKSITIKNVTFENGGHFAVLANGCTDMAFSNLKIRTPRDGIDLMACSNVLIENCDIRAIRYQDGKMAGGDDAIGIKSDFALGYKLDCENIVIRDCFLSSGCNPIQFGSETVGDIRNVRVNNCTIEYASKAGIGVTSNDGSVIEDVLFTDITMSKVANPIFINLTDRGRAPGEPKIGKIRNIKFKNITVTDAYDKIKDRKFTSTISGRPGHPVEDIVLDNFSIIYKGGGTKDMANIQVPYPENYSPRSLGVRPAFGFFVRHANNIEYHNVSVGFEKPDLRPALVLEDVNGIVLDNFQAQRAKGSDYDIILNNVRNLSKQNCEDLAVSVKQQ